MTGGAVEADPFDGVGLSDAKYGPLTGSSGQAVAVGVGGTSLDYSPCIKSDLGEWQREGLAAIEQIRDPSRREIERTRWQRAVSRSIDRSEWGPETSDHAYITIRCDACGHEANVPVSCGDRLCETCARVRQEKYRAYLEGKVSTILERGDRVRFITLTVKNGPYLRERLAHLMSSLNKLRERDIWKDNVIGGVRPIEVTYGEGGWHVHVHILCEGDYISQKELSSEWLAITGDSHIVDIRAVKTMYGAMKEMLKYPFKPSNAATWTMDQKAEFDVVMQGRRLYSTFGSWWGEKMVDDGPSVCPECGAEGSLFVISMTRRGCTRSFFGLPDVYAVENLDRPPPFEF